MRSNRYLSLLIVLLATPFAKANISYYDVFQNAYFDQTTAAGPSLTDLKFINFYSRVYDTAGDFTSLSINVPDNGVNTNTTAGYDNYTLNPSGTEWDYSDGPFPDEASIRASYPTSSQAGNYQIVINDALPIGEQNYTQFSLPDTARPDHAPALDPTSFTDLENAHAGQSVSVNWGKYGVGGPTDTNLVFFAVNDLTSHTAVVSSSGNDATYVGDTLPGADLIAGHNYSWDLYFSPRYTGRDNFLDPNYSFSPFYGAFYNFAFDYTTHGTFSVQSVPEPISMVSLGFGVLVLLRKRRK